MITRSLDRHSRRHRRCDHRQRATMRQANTTFPQSVTPRRGGGSATIRIRRSGIVNPINTSGQHGQHSPAAVGSSGVVSFIYLLILATVIGWATWSAATRTVSDISSCTVFDVMEMFGGIP